MLVSVLRLIRGSRQERVACCRSVSVVPCDHFE
jgi:hypothetical protein